MVTKYPLDWDLLKKGDELTASQLTQILGVQFGTENYPFAIMRLQGLIQNKTGFTVKTQKDGSLRILTDPEAFEHNQRIFASAMRSMAYRHALSCEVDPNNLTPEERRKHDRLLMTQSRYVSALHQTTKELRLRSGRGELQSSSEELEMLRKRAGA